MTAKAESSHERKTTIAVDRQAARAAQDELGTSTLVDTVNCALREIAARSSALRRQALTAQGHRARRP
jgi:hypothetical protein